MTCAVTSDGDCQLEVEGEFVNTEAESRREPAELSWMRVYGRCDLYCVVRPIMPALTDRTACPDRRSFSAVSYWQLQLVLLLPVYY